MMKNANILLHIVNFALGVFCVALLVSCAAMTCPNATIHSLPEECKIVEQGNWYKHCEEGQHQGRWGCCQYECRQVRCEGIYGRYTECSPGGTVLVDARCDSASGQCVQQTGVSQPIEGSGL